MTDERPLLAMAASEDQAGLEAALKLEEREERQADLRRPMRPHSQRVSSRTPEFNPFTGLFRPAGLVQRLDGVAMGAPGRHEGRTNQALAEARRCGTIAVVSSASICSESRSKPRMQQISTQHELAFYSPLSRAIPRNRELDVPPTHLSPCP